MKVFLRIAAIAAAAALLATGALVEPASATSSQDAVTLSKPGQPVPRPEPIPRPTERPIPKPPGGDPPPER